MITFLTGLLLAFFWVYFIFTGFFILCWFEENNYWMPPIYAVWSIVFLIITIIIAIVS